ncbi:MAG: 50S ribosomal protein L6 [Planctomycetes bacterium]|nr:50S ribosomal protein L6 [Planctomycetota bacterium]
MSRIGKLPVPVPKDVTASVSADVLTVEGSKGKLTQELPQGITAKIEEQDVLVEQETKRMTVVVFERQDESRRMKALHGTIRAHAANMVKGVAEGFEKKLQIVGVGYSAKIEGKTLELNVGYAHPVRFEIPQGIEIDVASATQFTVKGASKQLVGEVAAKIRAVQPPEPYKGKGIRYAEETVRRKAGKAFVATQ